MLVVMASVDYYKILGVPADSPAVVIKKAYRKLALTFHPDKNPENQAACTEKFKSITEAYQVVGDVKRRGEYDMMRRAGPSVGVPNSFESAQMNEIFKRFFDAQMNMNRNMNSHAQAITCPHCMYVFTVLLTGQMQLISCDKCGMPMVNDPKNQQRSYEQANAQFQARSKAQPRPKPKPKPKPPKPKRGLTPAYLRALKIKDLKVEILSRGLAVPVNVVEKQDLIDVLLPFCPPHTLPPTSTHNHAQHAPAAADNKGQEQKQKKGKRRKRADSDEDSDDAEEREWINQENIVNGPRRAAGRSSKKERTNSRASRQAQYTCSLCFMSKGSEEIVPHPLLGIPMCRECEEEYNTGDFKETDEDGNHVLCSFCADGGSVVCCDECPRVFCGDCLEALGKSYMDKIEKIDDWKCLVCDPPSELKEGFPSLAKLKVEQEGLKAEQEACAGSPSTTQKRKRRKIEIDSDFDEDEVEEIEASAEEDAYVPGE